MKFHHWLAALAGCLIILGPVACFLLWALLGRDGGDALGFAVLLIGLGLLTLWGASLGVDENGKDKS